MKHLATIVIAWALSSSAAILNAQEMPEMPPPTEEHEWLQRFVGDWESSIEFFMEPGQPPAEIQATERFRSIGGFWVVGDIQGEMMGSPFQGVFTVGYDPEEGKYTGTWIDSMSSFLWEYEGSLNEAGNILTLEAEGPCPMRPGELSRFRDVTEFRGNDRRIVTSFILVDGEWITTAKIDSRKKQQRETTTTRR